MANVRSNIVRKSETKVNLTSQSEFQKDGRTMEQQDFNVKQSSLSGAEQMLTWPMPHARLIDQVDIWLASVLKINSHAHWSEEIAYLALQFEEDPLILGHDSILSCP